ncbi:MAG: response regulator [Alphaproteobacteria bacterium]|nr:response regulator [Alphaproteobacteria bacterium]
MNEPAGGRAQILVVEDDRLHREFIAQILDNIGHSVTIAYDGSDALELAKQYDFDLILMDIEMPGIDGIETARRLRDMKRHREIAETPIIAISVEPDDARRAACLDAGMVDFIPKSIWKPKWEPDIREKIDAWLQNKTKHEKTA